MGHFDGQGHTVYGMYYRTYKEKYAYGLIPRANGNAVISNVNVRYAMPRPITMSMYTWAEFWAA
ncbi:MAG: hypothetical protein ACLR56_06025 [Oscillospiraceae bacterium]